MKYDGRTVTALGAGWVEVSDPTERISNYDTALLAAEAGETLPRVESANEATIRDRTSGALATNATFLGLASPTNAQIAAQVKALARQNNGLIRLALRRFDSAD